MAEFGIASLVDPFCARSTPAVAYVGGPASVPGRAFRPHHDSLASRSNKLPVDSLAQRCPTYLAYENCATCTAHYP
jgi:hypothetical protein